MYEALNICTVYMYSSLPMNVPIQNGNSGTSIIGAVMLMNQFGKNGVIRRNKR
jgi:homoserine kinase